MNLNFLVGLVSAILMIMGVGGATGKLPYNLLIGIRIAPVTNSPENWEVGHRAAAPVFITMGILGLLLVLLEALGIASSERSHSLQVWYMWAVVAALLIGATLAVRSVRALG